MSQIKNKRGDTKSISIRPHRMLLFEKEKNGYKKYHYECEKGAFIFFQTAHKLNTISMFRLSSLQTKDRTNSRKLKKNAGEISAQEEKCFVIKFIIRLCSSFSFTILPWECNQRKLNGNNLMAKSRRNNVFSDTKRVIKWMLFFVPLSWWPRFKLKYNRCYAFLRKLPIS